MQNYQNLLALVPVWGFHDKALLQQTHSICCSTPQSPGMYRFYTDLQQRCR